MHVKKILFYSSTLFFISSLNLANAFTNENIVKKPDYVCKKEKKADAEPWFVTMRFEETEEDVRTHSDICNADNKKCYALYCENNVDYGYPANYYGCSNNKSSDYNEGYFVFEPRNISGPGLWLTFSDGIESTTTTHYYKCAVNKL